MLLCENFCQYLRRIPSFLVYVSVHLPAVMFVLSLMGFLEEIRNVSVVVGVLERVGGCFTPF